MPRGGARPASARHQRGLSYIEVMVAALVIATTVGAAGAALESATAHANHSVEATITHYHLTALFETVLAEPFSSLEAAALGPLTPTTYSDTVGAERRRLVYIDQYDGDNADGDSDVTTGTDPDLLWIRVDVDGSTHSVQALRNRD